MRILAFLVLALVLWNHTAAFAQGACDRREVVVSKLAMRYGEEPVPIGVATDGRLFEVFGNVNTGTWSAVVTSLDMYSCIVLTGDGWRGPAEEWRATMPKKSVIWGQITAVGVGLAAISAGVIAYDDLRPYPTRTELRQVGAQIQQVAGRSCKNELSLLKQEKRDIERQIQRAKDQKNVAWERTLHEQMGDVRAEIARVKRECGWS